MVEPLGEMTLYRENDELETTCQCSFVSGMWKSKGYERTLKEGVFAR